MYIGEKSKIKVNQAQELELKKHFYNTRFVYNHFAGKVNEALKNNLDINFEEYKAELFELIKANDFLRFSPKASYTVAINNLKKAYLIVKEKKRLLAFKKERGRQSITLFSKHFELRKFKDRKKHYLRIYNVTSLLKVYNKRDFKGSIVAITLSFDGLNHYVSFMNLIDKNEYNRTHFKSLEKTKKGVGIDIGTVSNYTLSCGVKFNVPIEIQKLVKKLKREYKNLSRKQCPKFKGDKKEFSNNFYKQALKIRKINIRIRNLLENYGHQLSSLLLKFFDYFCLEDINLDKWFSKHSLAKKLERLSLGKFRDYLQYKVSNIDHKKVVNADQYYPSSKLCCRCGNKNNNLTVFKRTFVCEKCGFTVDRDLNAAANLYKYLKRSVGANGAELKFVDLNKLLAIAKLQGLLGERVEAKSCNVKRQKQQGILRLIPA